MEMIEKQSGFLRDVARLVMYAHQLEGVMLTGGDLNQDNEWHSRNSWGDVGDRERKPGEGPQYKTPHLKTGQHPKRLAIDLNLFVDGEYITGHHDRFDDLGIFWEGLNIRNRWGGNFKKLDYNHFERRG